MKTTVMFGGDLNLFGGTNAAVPFNLVADVLKQADVRFANLECGLAGEHSPGVAALQAHTAYRVPMHRAGRHVPPLNRPGIPSEVITWTDPAYLKRLREDLEQLRSKCDVVVASPVPHLPLAIR